MRHNNAQLDFTDLNALHFLAWLDVIERLDTLLLEARHLQQNVIYLLRAPDLYEPLRYEEEWLWSWDGWNALAAEYPTPSPNVFKLANNLARYWVLAYPRIGASEKRYMYRDDSIIVKNPKKPIEIRKRICKSVNQLAQGGHWNLDQRALYFNLIAIQEIKRHIVADRIITCMEGLSLFMRPFGASLSEPSSSARSFPRFLLFRNAVLARARNYVARLGDHQVLFARSQDHGLHDHPRPTLARRRDQHMYSNHLRTHCRNIEVEMLLLMNRLRENERPVRHPLIFHRWEHHFSSRSYSFENEFETDELGEPEPTNTSIAFVNYVNTSFWMPDRPDLQSIIAHEVAHPVIRERLYDLLPQKMDLEGGSFSSLLKMLQQCLDVFEVEERTGDRMLVREMAVDMLGAAVNGAGYVYALFLEIVGVGTEKLFAAGVSPERFELAAIDYLRDAVGPYAGARDWFIRLHVVCTWLEAITPADQANCNELENRLTNSCREAVDLFNDFLHQNAPQEEQGAEVDWRSLKKRLSTIVMESRAARETKEWLREREGDAGTTMFPRHTRKLHPEIRRFLIDGFRAKKRALLEGIKGTGTKIQAVLDDHFQQVYGIDIYALFSRIYDIPWQCAFLRALDFVHKGSKLNPKERKDFLWQVHSHAALGRELYQLVLDFYTHDVEPDWNRLAECVRVVKEFLWRNYKEKSPDLFIEELRKWCGDGRESQASQEKLISSLKKAGRAFNNGEEYSAWDLLKASPSVFIGPQLARLSQMQGYKLEELLRILLTYKKSLDSDKELAPLVSFLKIRAPDEEKSRNKQLIEAFSYGGESEKSKEPISAYMFTTICTSESYCVENPSDNVGFKYITDKAERGYRWVVNRALGWPENEEINEKYYILLGRYDVLSIMETRPMSRLLISRFYEADRAQLSEKHTVPEDPSFFARREMVIPLRLADMSWDEIDNGEKVDEENSDKQEIKEKTQPILAIISVALNRVAARLDFVMRLLEVTPPGTPGTSDPRNINELHGYFIRGDRAYLSDGWGDILIVLTGQPSRLGEIFKIQKVLFEDFQVEHTELILTPQCVTKAVGDPEYRVSVNARLLGDRSLARDNDEFIKGFKQNRTNLPFCVLTRLPGLMDVNVSFNPDRAKGNNQDVYKDMIMAIGQKRIDRLQTIIGKVES